MKSIITFVLRLEGRRLTDLDLLSLIGKLEEDERKLVMRRESMKEKDHMVCIYVGVRGDFWTSFPFFGCWFVTLFLLFWIVFFL